jgi:hypothetical protein
MGLYSKLSDLELTIENFNTETREKQVSEDFTRKTSVVKLTGKGKTGKGEDVIYEPERHLYPELNLEVKYTFDEFSEKTDELDLFQDVEHDETDEKYRGWALESAALDLALKQNNLSLDKALELDYKALKFVVSPSIGGIRDDKLIKLGMLNPQIEFKLDASEKLNEQFVEKLASKGQSSRP